MGPIEVGLVINDGLNDSDIYLATVTVEKVTGLVEAENQSIIFPNPASDYIDIVSQDTFSHLTVINSAGQTMAKKEINRNYRLDISALPNGMYILKLA
ncbi:T9SS type A sorting domain-containing protein, partial [Fulvivirga sp. RKSG066]|nr:T9SS type A sorting domain-containing protein [Fulvivirga aurantia]